MGIVASTWMSDLIGTSGGSTIPVAMLDAVDYIRTMSMVWLDMVAVAGSAIPVAMLDAVDHIRTMSMV